jgi:hypothetical protein
MHVGTLTAGRLAAVAEDGTLRAGATTVSWRVRPADTWIAPGAESTTRFMRPEAAPLFETAMRVPGGDARQRVYAVDVAGGAVVVEVENASPSAIAIAFVVDDQGSWTASYSKRAGATEADGAVVFPVPHRTSVRVALPDAESVVRGWDRLLDRGMRVELPAGLQHEVDAARADGLLAPPSGEAFATLEAWGFDDEAIAMWPRLGLRARRAARRASGVGVLGVLGEIRAALVTESDRSIAAFPGFRTAWLGQSLAVHDAPMRSGRASFALRWHGARPALLWDVPAGMTLRAPVLDPLFVTTEPAGERLLAEPPAALLPMGERAPVGGTAVRAPEEFS